MIYLDHAAATPVSKKAREAMEPYFSELFFNPSAPYFPAKRVREDYEDAKNRLAHIIGAKGNDLVITSGATEATNLAFTVLDSINHHPLNLTVHTLSSNDLAAESRISTSTSIPETEFRTLAPVSAPEVLILETEHASVMSTARKYKYNLIKVDKNGRIDLSDLQQKITNRTALISVSLVNNELGTIQPLSEIAEIIKKVRENRLAEHNRTPLYLHSDASQALGLLNINIARLKVDLLTLNSAKVYGPKGVGALYVAHGVKLQPISTGGGQERGLRSGTENVAGLIGFAKAAEEAKRHLDSNRKKYENYRKIFQETLSTSFSKNTTTTSDNTISETPLMLFLGNKKHQLTSFCPISFPGLDAERLIYKLEEKEVYLSTGAACAASKGEPSHVLKAIGLSDSEIAGSLRISFGETNDEEQIRAAANLIATAVREEWSRLIY